MMNKQELIWNLKELCKKFPLGINTMSARSALLTLENHNQFKTEQASGFPIQVNSKTLLELEKFVDGVLAILEDCNQDDKDE